MAKEITKMARGGSKYHGVMKATKSNEMAWNNGFMKNGENGENNVKDEIKMAKIM
jgi:hypothetical protein